MISILFAFTNALGCSSYREWFELPFSIVFLWRINFNAFSSAAASDCFLSGHVDFYLKTNQFS